MGENIRYIKKLADETKELKKHQIKGSTIIPILEGTIQYLYYITKDYDDIDEYKQFIDDKIKYFEENKDGNSEAEVTLFTLKKALRCLDLYDCENMDELRKKLDYFTRLMFESRMYYHKKVFENPNLKIDDFYNSVGNL